MKPDRVAIVLRYYSAVVTIGLVLAGAFIWKIERVDSTSSQQGGAVGTPLEVQRICAEGADRAFHAGGYDKPAPYISASYTNHYDPRLNRCFIEIAVSDLTNAKTSGSTMSVGLWDAFEGHVLGEYVEVVDKQGQPSISLCFLKPPDAPLGTEARQCHSKIEWQNMVREHMGSGAME